MFIYEFVEGGDIYSIAQKACTAIMNTPHDDGRLTFNGITVNFHRHSHHVDIATIWRLLHAIQYERKNGHFSSEVRVP